MLDPKQKFAKNLGNKSKSHSAVRGRQHSYCYLLYPRRESGHKLNGSNKWEGPHTKGLSSIPPPHAPQELLGASRAEGSTKVAPGVVPPPPPHPLPEKGGESCTLL